MDSKRVTNPTSRSRHIAIAIDLGYAVPWHHDCYQGIRDYARRQGWSYTVDPLFMDHGGAGAAGGYDGVIGRIGAEVAREVQAQGLPVVNHWMNSPVKDLPSLAVDSRTGGQMAGEHLATCGYRSLGILYVQDDVSGFEYLEGMGRAAADAGLAPPSACQLATGYEPISSREAFAHFMNVLDRWITGLTTPVGLCVGDGSVAQYLAQRCNHLGLSVPGDVGIIVWDDSSISTAISPTMSAIEHDWFKVGYEAAAMLDELMQGKAVHPLRRHIAPNRVIRRDSTDVFLCEDALVKQAMKYISEHCRQELKAVEVADALNVSERTLYRRFDEVLGRSIKDEINRLRADRLRLMVSETQMPLKQIAETYGFSTPTQFSRFFSRAAGMTPSAYREKFAAEAE